MGSGDLLKKRESENVNIMNKQSYQGIYGNLIKEWE